MFSFKNKKNNHNIQTIKDYYEIALIGNPNVGKSTVFNKLTGMNQHTGNWSGKTVENAQGFYTHNSTKFKVVDLPGTYSVNSDSPDELVVNDYINSNKPDCIVIIVNATILERNLNLVLQILNIYHNAILCINMIDQAIKNNITIDTDELSLELGIPVIATTATYKKGIEKLKNQIYSLCKKETRTFKIKAIKDIFNITESIKQIVRLNEYSKAIVKRCVRVTDTQDLSTLKIDRIVTSKKYGIPIMIALMLVLFFITTVGADYISDILMRLFDYLKIALIYLLNSFNCNQTLLSIIVDGIYTTLTWIIAVMLPAMSIFFPLFSILEDSGFLPRIAFNLDSCFKRAGTNGKQALCMAMGFGCNACGVVGCRIINSKSQRNTAIITNNFIPCNGRLPSIITISGIFISTSSYIFNSILTAFAVFFTILISIIVTMLVTKLLAKYVFKENGGHFIIELPTYKKPQIMRTIINSFRYKVLSILSRAIIVAIPTGLLIWLLTNIYINEQVLIDYVITFFEPFSKHIGLDGVIITAFLLGFAANETVIPIMLMSYLSAYSLSETTDFDALGQVLTNNGWTVLTAVCFIIITIFHFPCSTTCLTIKKETDSIKLTVLSIILPTLIGVILCFLITVLSNLIHIYL